MTGSTLAVILIPAVVAVCLVVWITMVYHADRHPHQPGRRGDVPGRAVTGGIFQGDPGQVSPRRDAEPKEAAELRHNTGASKE
jgi:hypothetical protein